MFAHAVILSQLFHFFFLSFFTSKVLNSPFQMYVKYKRANKWQEEPKFKHSKVEMVHKMAWQRMWWNNWKTWDNEILSEHQGLFQVPPYRFNLFFSFSTWFYYFVRYWMESGKWKGNMVLELSNQFATGETNPCWFVQFKIPSKLRYISINFRITTTHISRVLIKNEKKWKKSTERKNDWHLKCVLRTLNRLEKCTIQQPNMQILTHNTWIFILTWFVFRLNLHYPVTIHFLVSCHWHEIRILPREYLTLLTWHAFVMFVYFTYFPF